MKSNIHDARLKCFIREYKRGDEKAYLKAVDMISEYIYNYPRIVFGADPDGCGDFYEYILVRLDDILGRFRDTGAKFITWFTVVLRNRYFNFMRESRKGYLLRERINQVSLDFENGRSSSLYNIVGDIRDYSGSSPRVYDETIDMIVRELNDRYRVFFHLYFIETLRPEDVGFLSIYLERSPREVLEGIDGIRCSMVRRYEFKRELLLKLTSVYYMIMQYQREGDARKVEGLREKRKKLIFEYRYAKLNPSYRSISGFLGFPLGTVSSGIMRMKSRAQHIVKQRWEGGNSG